MAFGGAHHHPGTASLAGDHTERSLRNRPVGVPGVHMIEQILRLETQLQAARFAPQPEIFQKREIPLAEARAAHIRYGAAHIADLEADRKSTRLNPVTRSSRMPSSA